MTVTSTSGERVGTPESKRQLGSGPGVAGISALALIAILLLTWLFVRADAVSMAEHGEYRRDLRQLLQADAELDAAILASRFGLSLNYDRIVATIADLERLATRINTLPGHLSEPDRAILEQQMLAYRQLVNHKAALVEHFKTENAVLRNSLPVFPLLVERFISEGTAAPETLELLARLARNVLSTALNTRISPEHPATDDLAALNRLAIESEADTGERLLRILAHGRIINERKPELDALSREILNIPTVRYAEAMAEHYGQATYRASLEANRYRQLLYVSALLLAAYLALAMLRLIRASADLESANIKLTRQIGALHRTQDELRLLATVFTNASEGMVITDDQIRIIAVNPAFTRITGYSLAEVAGHTPNILNSGRQSEHFYRDMWAALSDHGKWQGEIWNRRHDGSVFPEWLSISVVSGADGKPGNYIGIFTDISERKDAEARIHHLANHDALTELPNRILLQDRLDQAILQNRREGTHTAVLCLDLDRFKNINDTLGHETGDKLLVQVARRCRDTLRESDTIARQGGDEFVIVLSDLNQPQDATLAARKLLEALERPYKLANHTLTVTGSIGIAIHPEDGETVSSLLRHADTAMYRAKANGRNGLAFYSEDMNVASLGTLLLENQLRGVIERNELDLHYQPKVDAASGRVTGLEALVRWRHPELGLLSPARFIPLAEESGLIVPIGEWVLIRACAQLREWIDRGFEPVSIAVNLSAQQFRHQDLVRLVRDTLDDYDIAPRLLELELTETLLMDDAERTVAILGQLRAMGVSLAIDDFGTGFSSLAYLRQFPVQTLKIDRSFVAEIDVEESGDKIIPAIIALAHNLGLTVVAEGVEAAHQGEYLKAHDCDCFQGYLYGKPMPAASLAQWLQPAG